MKSIDKFVLVLVASLALLLAGCGGGSSTTTPVDPGPTAGEMAIMQAQTALTNAEAGLSGAGTDAAMLAAYRAIQSAADNLVTALSTHGGSAADIATAARKSGNAKAMADDLAEQVADAEMKANMAMVATAMKLHAGISAPTGDGTGASDRFATYGTGDNAADIAVTFGDGTNAGTAVNLSEDEDATVAAHHGWEGMMFTAEPDGEAGTYEAVVYSHVGESTQGKKFAGPQADDEFEYALVNGAVAVDTATAGVPARVALTGVTRTAGTETFNLPDPNPGGATIINVPGSFHGVSGTYNCTPTTAADGCSASVAASGFTLEGGTWTFTPNDPATRLMETPDNMYASYGWWLHKSEDGSTFTASAFHDYRGTAPTVEIAALRGTASYSGGAAGKYALSSTTGGTNDAGHFTANAMLEAKFGEDHTISGTIDNFVGADGESRNWSVDLMSSTVSDAGAIAGDPATAGNTDAQMTQWTIDGTDGAAAGQWSGSLREEDDDGVPGIGTGTFHSTFGRDGMMVGAFGVNRDD